MTHSLPELPQLGESISATLQTYAPGSALRLVWGEVQPPEIALPEAQARLVEDHFEGAIDRKGHGLQRALILALLQHLALSAAPPADVDASGTEQESDSPAALGDPDLILAIEEPELYQHPSRSRYLSDLLMKLIVSRDGEAQNQILYTTHSPYFVDLHRFDHIRVVRKTTADEDSIPACDVSWYALEDAAARVAELCEMSPDRVNRDTFRARASGVMNVIVNEGFFANVVVVVEGTGEVGVLWKLQELLEQDWARLGVAIVPAGGKTKIGHAMVVFSGLSIPCFFLFDGDSSMAKTESSVQNRRYLRLAGANENDFPDTQCAGTFAVFGDKMESTIEEQLGKDAFREIVQETADEYGYESSDKVLKNSEGAAQFIELTYNRGKRIPFLEQIVESISALASG